MIEQAHQCAMIAAPSIAPKVPSNPSFDALAASFGGLAVAVTWVAVGITGLAILMAAIGFAWGRVVVREAKEDAREEANRLISEWLRDEAPRIIRDGRNSLSEPQSPFDDPDDASDQIGKAAG